MEANKQKVLADNWSTANFDLFAERLCSDIIDKSKIKEIDVKLMMFDNCKQKFISLNDKISKD